jgi:hypothetical protein
MIVPVKRWANAALFGYVKPAREPETKTEPAKKKRRAVSPLVTFEKMMAAQMDHVIRGISE